MTERLNEDCRNNVSALLREIKKKNNYLTENKAVYTAISVACGWARAVISPCQPQNSKIYEKKINF